MASPDPRLPADPGGGRATPSVQTPRSLPSDPSGGRSAVAVAVPEPRLPSDPGGGRAPRPTFPYIAAMSPVFGPYAGGTTVTLTGERFAGATSVTIGGTAATIVSNTDTELVITTGPKTFSGTTPDALFDVIVTAAAGTSATIGAYRFTHYVPPTITSISPVNGAPAGNDRLSIAAQGAGYVTGVYFDGTAGTSISATSTTIGVTTPAHAAGVVDVILRATHPAPVGVVDSVANPPTTTFEYLSGGPVVTGITPIPSGVTIAEGHVAGGATVTITGTGFTGATQVVFGTNVASYSVVNDTTITATVPPASNVGLVYVRVTTPVAQSQQVAAALFRYYRTCVISSITPNNGPTDIGISVTITGTGFTGATTVTVDGVPASFNVSSDTSITITTPTHAAGAVHIRVTNTRETSAAVPADLFTYIADFPRLTSISPSWGFIEGGTTVTVTGANLANVTSLKIGSLDATIVSQTATQIVATTPAGASPGSQQIVTATNAGATSTSTSVRFTYYSHLSITSVVPASGLISGNSSVTINGAGFMGTAGSTANIKFDGISVSSIVTYADSFINIRTPAHAVGTVSVVVTHPVTGETVTATNSYTYVDTAPTITDLSTHESLLAGGGTMTVTGLNLSGATSVTIAGTSVTPITNTATSITFTIPPRATPINGYVIVTTPAGTTVSNADAVFRYYRPCTVTGVSPSSGPTSGGTTVTITGTGFLNATAVEFGGAFGVGLIVDSDTQIRVTTPARSTGTVDVRVSNIRETSPVNSPADQFTFTSGAPTISNLSPNEGPIAGGTTVTITGTNLAGTTSVTIDGVSRSFTQVSGTQVTFVTPAHAIGNVTVIISTPTASASATFRYYAPLTITSLSPNHGPTAGGTTVVITGTGFTGVAPGGVLFDAAPAETVSVASDTQITVTTPAHIPGVAAVTVTNPRATSSPASFTYEAPAPVITSLSPNEGLASGGTAVTITGTDLGGATSVTIGGASVSFAQVSNAQITFVTPDHAVGVVPVVVTTASGSDSENFTYYRSCTVTGITPALGPVEGGTTVTVTGTGFTGATTVLFGGTPGTSLTVISDTQLTVVSPAHVVGTVHVQVTNTRETSPTGAADQFEYRTAPTVTSMSPVEGPIAGGTTVTLTGTHLDTVTALTVGGASTPYTIVNPTQITFVTPAHAVGAVVVAVADTHGAQASPPTTFLYYAPLAVTGLTPTTGTTNGGTTVTITGSGFTGATAVAFGSTPGTSINVVNDSTLTVRTPVHPLGVVDVRVTNSRATSPITPADEFRFVPTPALSTITPNSGPVVGGTSVTIVGTNLTDATSVRFGSIAALNVVVVNDSTITATSPINTTPGPVGVTVTTPGGTSAPISFTYTNQPPVAVASATPTTGDAILTVQFSSDGSSDPDGGFITSWLWDFGDGATSSMNAPVHSFMQPGTYTVSLTVADNTGATATTTIEIIVTERPANVAPIAVAFADATVGDAPHRVRFTGDESYDTDGTIVLYEWNFGDGTLGYGPNPIHTYSQPGTYDAILTVTDNNGARTAAAPITIYVGVPPVVFPPVIASIAPNQGSSAGGTAIRIKGEHLLGVESVEFIPVGQTHGTAGTVLRIVDDNSMSVLSPPGTGKVNIRLTNSEHTSATSAATLFTYLTPPLAVASATPVAGYAPLAVEFSSNGSRSPYGIRSYYWTFGDGTILNFGDNDSSTERNPSHTYANPGVYTATLTITDGRGIVASATVAITVIDYPGGGSGGGGGGGGGGNGGGEPGGHGGGTDPDPTVPQDPIYIDADCEVNSGHILKGYNYYSPGTPAPNPVPGPLFSEEWTARRLPSGILFSVHVTVLRSFLKTADPKFKFPSKVFFGAISITADGNFPSPPPTGTTANEGLVKAPRILSVSGVTLTPQLSAGLFTPVIGDGDTGIEEGASFTLSGLAPPELEIAYAQVGFLDADGRGVGDVSVAWIAVDCTIERVSSTTGWTIGGPNMAGGGSGFVIRSRPPGHRKPPRGGG